ncbi:MAG: hypothetical protein ACYDH5_07330 [Acidimicrobiales bacterium]
MLRRLLVVFLFSASAFSFVVAYQHQAAASVTRMEDAGPSISRPFAVPAGPVLSSPHSATTLYPLLRNAALRAHVNVFRTSIGYSRSNKPEIIQYALLAGPTRFYQSFHLSSGHWLTPRQTQRGTAFLASQRTGARGQVGVLREFGGRPLIEVRPMQASYRYLAFPGQYWVEGPVARYKAFAALFASALDAHLGPAPAKSYPPQVFLRNLNASGNAARPPAFGTWANGITHYVRYVWLMTTAVTLMLIVYYGFGSAKRMGIMKLHGLSNVKVWYLLIGRLVLVTFALFLAIWLVMAATIPHTTAGFIGSVVYEQCLVYGLVMMSSSLAYLYSRRVRVGDAVKSRKGTTPILVVNTVVKATCAIGLIFLMLGVWSQYAQRSAQLALVHAWVSSQPGAGQYGLLYPTRLAHDYMGAARGLANVSYVEARWLYPYLDRRGALFVDAYDYEATILGLPQAAGTIRSIRVNPNYLHQFPVYNTRHQPVQVPDTSQWVLLVPVQYRSRKAAILRYFHRSRSTASAGNAPFRLSRGVLRQRIRIIWTANHQQVFSFDPTVFPGQGNMVLDPIIQVMTEKNSTLFDRASMLSGGLGEALKVKLVHGSTAATEKALAPELGRLGLTGYLGPVTTVGQAVAQYVRTLQTEMWFFLAVGAGLMASGFFLVAQNVGIFFTRYHRRFLVRRLFGAGLARTYREYGLFVLASWLGQIAIVLGMVQVQAASMPAGASSATVTPDVRAAIVGTALFVLEMAASGLVVVRRERRALSEAMKEGT